MVKNFIIILSCLICCCFIINITVYASDWSIQDFLEQLRFLDQQLAEEQEIVHIMAECARDMGYIEDYELIIDAQTRWKEIHEQRKLKTEQSNIWTKRYNEYPYATYIWLYLTYTCNYNDYVAAGIIGNMMAEVGNETLNLQYNIYDYTNSYYGICQWSKKYYPDVCSTDLIIQCNFLSETIQEELDTFGYMYLRGYQYEDFLKLSTVNETALMFAKSYERCGSGSYYTRQLCASIAYNYFTGLY